jgi:hypothetical protein
LKEYFGTYIIKDSDGSKFFGENFSLEPALQNLIANVKLPFNHKFPLLVQTNDCGIINAYPGWMNTSKERKCVKEISKLLKEGKSFYCYEEYVICKEAMERLIDYYHLPRKGSFFNENSMVMTKVAVFFQTVLLSLIFTKIPLADF